MSEFDLIIYLKLQSSKDTVKQIWSLWCVGWLLKWMFQCWKWWLLVIWWKMKSKCVVWKQLFDCVLMSQQQGFWEVPWSRIWSQHKLPNLSESMTGNKSFEIIWPVIGHWSFIGHTLILFFIFNLLGTLIFYSGCPSHTNTYAFYAKPQKYKRNVK